MAQPAVAPPRATAIAFLHSRETNTRFWEPTCVAISLQQAYSHSPLDVRHSLPQWCQLCARADDTKAKTEIFDEAWRTTRDKFYDRKLNGLDWDAVGDKHRAEYAAAKTDAERAAAINAMLAELGASHTHYYTKDEPAYYELADIFAGALRRELPKQFPGSKISYPGIGIFTKTIDGKTFVSGVFPGQPAAKAGLLLGDEIVSPLTARPSSRSDHSATRSASRWRSRSAAPPMVLRQTLRVEPQNLDPGDTFESALKDSARIIEVQRPAHRLRARMVVRRPELPGAARGHS